MSYNTTKILIAGSNGFIGYNLIKKLKERNDVDVVGVMHSRTDKIVTGVMYDHGDLTDPNFCNIITKNKDWVFHCAASTSGAAANETDPLLLTIPNVVMNAYLLDACYKNGVKKFMWFASTTGYPDSVLPVTEDMMFQGDPYEKYYAVGWMKRYTETLCNLYSHKIKNPMGCIVLRPTNIYGPGDKIDPNKSHVLAALIRKVVERQNPIEIWGDGKDVRDLIYIDDFIDVILLAMEKQSGYDPLNIGYGQTYSVMEMLDIIKKVADYDAPVKFLSDKPRMIPIRRVSIEKACEQLNWTPKVSLEEGVRKTYQWMKKQLEKENGITGMYD